MKAESGRMKQAARRPQAALRAEILPFRISNFAFQIF